MPWKLPWAPSKPRGRPKKKLVRYDGPTGAVVIPPAIPENAPPPPPHLIATYTYGHPSRPPTNSANSNSAPVAHQPPSDGADGLEALAEVAAVAEPAVVEAAAQPAPPPPPPVPVPEISIDELRAFVQERREPCVIRSSGNKLKIVKGCACSASGTAVEDGIVGGAEWLAQQIGSTKFRVFVSRPADASKKQQRDKSLGNDANNANANANASTFTLDGTDHPDTVLTTSMSMEMTLEEMLNDPHWRCRYMVEDDLPVDNTPLQSLVPTRPPSPLVQAYGNDDRDDHSNTEPLPEVKQRQLFVSFGPCQTQLHRDCFDNFYLCAFGERQWTLVPPNNELQREAGSVSASISPNSLHSSPTADGPKLDVTTTTLRAGDVMFIPAHYWHSVRSMSPSSVAINWYFEPFEVMGISNKRQKVAG